MTSEQLATNIAGIDATLQRVLANATGVGSTTTAAPTLAPDQASASLRVVNNADWFTSMNVLEFIGRVGKHLRMHSLLSRDSVKSRLETEDGMSFTEFSYQAFQAYDFVRLASDYDCSVQLGGSDQWGNIVTGIDLIKKTTEMHGYGITMPLLTTASGEKFGKSMGNAVWLDRTMTSPYQLYQFFVNVSDDEVERYLKALTLIGLEDIGQVNGVPAIVCVLRLPRSRLSRLMT
jgi:tyrosyl-tRNA synthetase